MFCRDPPVPDPSAVCPAAASSGAGDADPEPPRGVVPSGRSVIRLE
jgi:hypothetical protein